MKFTKMHGCGNDYIYVDGAREIIPAERKSEVVKFLSDRHFGIGGDGVIFINPMWQTSRWKCTTWMEAVPRCAETESAVSESMCTTMALPGKPPCRL